MGKGKSMNIIQTFYDSLATRREELSESFLAAGCEEAVWKFPEDTGFYQPIVIAKKEKLPL